MSQEHQQYCTPPVLDDNVEEGVFTKKSKTSRFYFSSATAEITNSVLKKMDAGARLLLRQVSYGALMTTYLDQNVKSEETIKHISDLFQ